MSTEDRLKEMIDSAHTEGRASEAEWNQFTRRAHGALFRRRAGAVVSGLALVSVAVVAVVVLQPEGSTPAPNPPAASTPANATPEPSQAPEQETQLVTVETAEREQWYAQGEKLSWGTTVYGGRIDASLATDDPITQEAALWLQTLVAGGTAADQEAGTTTAIPKGTELLHVGREGETLIVDLSPEFSSGGGSLSMQMRVAQVVYTGTQFQGIESVKIWIDGEDARSIGGEGIDVSRPLTRRDFQDLAPNIIVESPKPGDELRTYDTISGFANVFEANVAIRVIDENGKKILETFATATCGTGCWGDYEKELLMEIDHDQDGRLEVLTYSAEDGSETDLVSIPVRLISG
jgi:spore germination protein GerM